MGLFYRRPLALCCAFFILTSALVTSLGIPFKIFLAVAVCISAAVVFLIRRLSGKKSLLLIGVSLCLAAVAIGALNSAIRIDAKTQKAQEWVGERSIVADVREVSYASKGSYVYVVDIERMSDRDADVKALLVLGFDCDLRVGDRFVSTAEIMKMSDVAMGRSGYERTNNRDVLLTALVAEPNDSQVLRFDRELPLMEKLLCENGFFVVADEIKTVLSQRFNSLLGEEYGGLVNAVLLGDTSGVDTQDLRDFRRSGVSHLFAVSGLHISVLLGAAELLLSRLYVPKGLRCVTVTALALILLVLTGFSMSAFRAVLMLWVVYVAFIFADDTDAITSLFLSVTAILLIFPFAVYELGMWMSFLATLGLLTVYKAANRAIPWVRKGIMPLKILLRALRFTLMMAVMTLVANMFLLPIQWGIFGEISLTSIPTNLLLAPLNGPVLIGSVLCLALGGVPILGEWLCTLLGGICEFTLDTAEAFSTVNGATLSLEYPFVAPLVAVFCAALLAVLTLRLKRRWLVYLPFAGFALLFAVGVGVFDLFVPRTLTYHGYKTNEIISVTDGTELCVVDMSDGRYGRLDGVLEDSEKYGATDVDTVVLTEIERLHLSDMKRLFQSQLVGRIYIPKFSDTERLERAYEMSALAKECGVDTFTYRSGDVIEVGDTRLLMIYGEGEERLCVSVFVEGKQTLFGYTDATDKNGKNFSDVDQMLAECDTVLVGRSGVSEQRRELNTSPDARVIYASADTRKRVGNNSNDGNTYVSKFDKLKIRFKFR